MKDLTIGYEHNVWGMKYMVHVLQIMVGTCSFGGAEQFALSYYEHMDRTKIQYDFLFLSRNVLMTVNNSCLKESRIYEIGTWNKNNNFLSYIKTIKRLIEYLRENKYDIVHINSGIKKVEICCLIAARISGMNVRIAHSHTSKPVSRCLKESVLDKLKAALVRSLATDYFACSKAAGGYLFGCKGIRSKKFRIIKNAIDLKQYQYNKEKDMLIRQREKVGGELIFGHVGRFVEVKNQLFLIDVFKIIHNQLPDAQLWMIGDGELFDTVQHYIAKCNLSKHVRLYGERNDVFELMQSMDALIFPSKFEGLSMVVVESQAAGMNTFVSDSISKEHKLSSHIWFLSLDKGPEYWSAFIIEKMDGYKKRTEIHELADNGYDIQAASVELQNYYLSRVGTKHEK